MRLKHAFAGRAAARLLLTAAAVASLSCEAARVGRDDARGDAPAAAPDLASMRVVDLSHSYDAETVYWPTAERTFKLEKDFEGRTEGGYFYAANSFSTAEHGGTHLDAPVHFAEGKQTVDQIPLTQLTGAAVVVDVSEKCERDADYQVSVADFEEWERANGGLPRGSIVILRTGYGRRWPDRKSYMGTDERGAGAVAKLHFPGLHPEAARWLVERREPKAVGLDTPSIDYGQSKLFESHRILFERNVPAFENLANLGELPAKDFYVVALPMKIKGGSGGPLRAAAFIRN
ncbi:MAG TPA: cyclase family protein [Pyrinomonadaceae bacterium]|nr:cyclase family protein [Pyrinomonadaceae bacterium]